MSKQTAMQALVDLLKVKDAYKQCMPYIIEIIDEVYLPMEREQAREHYIAGFSERDDINSNLFFNPLASQYNEKRFEEYYNKFKGGKQ